MQNPRVHHLIPVFSAKYRHLAAGSMLCTVVRDDSPYMVGNAVTIAETNWRIRGLTGNTLSGEIVDIILEHEALEYGNVILGIKITG